MEMFLRFYFVFNHNNLKNQEIQMKEHFPSLHFTSALKKTHYSKRSGRQVKTQTIVLDFHNVWTKQRNRKHAVY